MTRTRRSSVEEMMAGHLPTTLERTFSEQNELVPSTGQKQDATVPSKTNKGAQRGVQSPKTDLSQVKAVRDEAIRTELPPLVKPRLEKDLTEAVQRHFNGPHRNMSIQGKVLRRYGTLEEALIYAVDAPRCGGVTLSGFKRYECREGRMYHQQVDEDLWLKLPAEVPRHPCV